MASKKSGTTTEEIMEAVIKEETGVKVKVSKKLPDPILGQDQNIKFIEKAVEINQAVLLIGETGTGKTSIVKHIAALRGQSCTRFNLTGETTVDEFVGKYTLRDNGKGVTETVWQDGVLLEVMKKGGWLICDEINVALPEILFVLHSLLDDDRSVMVANHDGETVLPHPDFRFFATMNPVDEYAGTKELNKAFRSRFGMTLFIETPDEKVETEIIQSRTGTDVGQARMTVMVGNLLRALKKDNKIFLTVSTRDLLQWASLARHIDPGHAFRATILNKSDNAEERDIIKKEVTTLLGTLSEFIVKGNEHLDPKWFAAEFKKLEDARKADMSGMRAKIAEEERKRIISDMMGKLGS